MSTLKISGCMSVVKDMSDLDRDALLARLDQYRADGVPVERAQVMAAADTLAELEDERREFMRMLKEQHPEIFAVTAPKVRQSADRQPFPRGYVGPMSDEEREQGRLVGRLEDESYKAWRDGREKVAADTVRWLTERMRKAGIDDKDVKEVSISAARDLASGDIGPGGKYDPETHPYFSEYRAAADKLQAARVALQQMVDARVGPPEFDGMQQLADFDRPQVRTPEFRRWFKDSKVVDDQGRPLIVFHGTNKDLTEFATVREDGAVRNNNWFGQLGSWFAAPQPGSEGYDVGSAEATADVFAEMRGDEGSVVYPVYLSIQNPYDVEGYDSLVDERDEAGGAVAFRAMLVEKGYDGVVVRESSTDGGQYRDDWVAFYPTQIKSAIGNSGAFATDNPDITKSADRTPLGFYSALARSIDGVPIKSAPAGAWKTAIKGLLNKGAIKQDELEWSGLEDWMDLQQGKISKEQVAEYLKEGGVQVEETVLSDAAVRALPEGWYVEEFKGANLGDMRFIIYDQDDERVGNGATYEEALDDAIDEDAYADDPRAPKYANHTLPGGNNYREVLLTLPSKEPTTVTRFQVLTSRGELVQTVRDRARAERLAEGLEGYTVREVRMPGSDNPNANLYRSNHWDQPNVLAHIRMNDRTDADGNRVLFVEELQSDWGQAGKKKGFRDDSRQNELRAKSKALREEYEAAYQQLLRQADSLSDAEYERRLAQLRDMEDAVQAAAIEGDTAMRDNEERLPVAPFITKTEGWLNLALKRVMVMAAEGGYDKVAFVNGEQSADRYDLSKQVDAISWERGSDGRITFTADKAGEDLAPPQTVAADRLDDYLGKEIASKIVNSDKRSGYIEGVDLKVGGAGMKAFYDTIVPTALKKLLPKVGGGQMEEVQIERPRMGEPRVPGRPMSSRILAQPGFDVTDAMREKVAGGLPLFSADRDQIETPEFKKWFGKSKVVNGIGKPRVVYHGTAGDVAIFDMGRAGQTYGLKDEQAFFFTGYIPTAESAADDATDLPVYRRKYMNEGFGGGMDRGDSYGGYDDGDSYDYTADYNGGQNIMPVYLSLQNPLIIDADQGYGAGTHLELRGSESPGELIARAKAEGHDGIIIRGKYRNYESIARINNNNWLSDQEKKKYLDRLAREDARKQQTDNYFIAFRPDQIKSAIGNIGAFGQRPVTAEEAERFGMGEMEAEYRQYEGDIRFSADRDYEPKKTVKAYKLFRTDARQPGKLFPLFVLADQAVPMGEWLRAEIGPMSGDKVKSKLGPLAFRPGWHAGDVPVATHIGMKDGVADKKPKYRNPEHVWAEVEFAADVDWQAEANKRGTNASGKLVPVRAHITDQLPVGGFYRYKTNPNMEGTWLIGGEMKVNRVLSDSEVKRINDKAGTADLPRKEPLDLKAKGFPAGRPTLRKSEDRPGGDSDVTMSADRPWFDDLSKLKVSTNYQLGDLLKTSKKLSWWDRTVGTQYGIAQKHPQFKRVFDAVQTFINDVSAYASRAADLAPTILPKLETLKDITRSPLSAEDVKALRDPIFGGTLKYTRDDEGNIIEADDVSTAGVVFTNDELRSLFGLNDRQVKLYREFRRATNKSLTDLAVSDMLRYLGTDGEGVRQRALEAPNLDGALNAMVAHLDQLIEQQPKRAEVLEDTKRAIKEKAGQAIGLMARGYAPLSRFGQYTVYAVGKDGEQIYFSMFENERDANKMAREMREQYPEATVTTGTMSTESYKLFSGVTPETLALFGESLGLEESGVDAKSEVFQQYLKMAKTNRSAMKRLIQRKGIDGFSEDAGRVLAGFVYSNARQISTNLHAGEISRSAAAVTDGDVKDAAIRLMEYVQNPMEEAQAIRGLMFTQFIGGSIASAMVNMTQPFTMTLPYLSQFDGATGAAKRMADAVKLVSRGVRNDEDLQKALKRAEQDGVVSPQEVHQLMAQAQGKGSLQAGDGTKVGDAAAKVNNAMAKLGLVWGKLFSAAEQFNRRVTFIAAYKLARDQGMENPFAFAEKAIAETQGVYNKGNKPKWARGAVGSTLFTFKQYSIAYMEFLVRMWGNGPEGKKAVGLALAVLFMTAGLSGLPGMDDLDDVIDGFMQRVLGKSFDSKQAKKEFFASILGQAGAEFVMSGLSGLPGVPIDVSGRMGLGNLIPGTGLLTKKRDYGRDYLEIVGPAGTLFTNAGTAVANVAQGEVKKAAEVLAPVAAQNAIKAVDMAQMGYYRDAKGRKVVDTDAFDALAKGIGFQPRAVAQVQEATAAQANLITQNKLRETEIADKWARGRIERKPDLIEEAKQELADWNRKNPDSRIQIDQAQINKRVQEANKTKAQRVAATAPKEIRGAVKKELEAELRD